MTTTTATTTTATKNKKSVYLVYEMWNFVHFPEYKVARVCATKPVAQAWVQKRKNGKNGNRYYHRIEKWDLLEDGQVHSEGVAAE